MEEQQCSDCKEFYPKSRLIEWKLDGKIVYQCHACEQEEAEEAREAEDEEYEGD